MSLVLQALWKVETGHRWPIEMLFCTALDEPTVRKDSRTSWWVRGSSHLSHNGTADTLSSLRCLVAATSEVSNMQSRSAT